MINEPHFYYTTVKKYKMTTDPRFQTVDSFTCILSKIWIFFQNPKESLSQPILRKVFKKLILSPKMTYFPHFGNNKNFPFTCRTFTLNHFSMPKIRYNFTEIEWADLEKSSKCAHFPHFEHNNIFLKNEKFLPDFYPIFHVSHQE